MSKQNGKISLFSLALPILIEQVLRNFLGTVNVLMLGNYSDDAVAAVGVANQSISPLPCSQQGQRLLSTKVWGHAGMRTPGWSV